MLLRAVRSGLAGALVAWTLLRLLGLDLGWPIVPLFAFTPWVAALAVVGALAAALFGRKLFALLVGALAGAVFGGKLFALLVGPCALLLIVALAPRVVPNRAPADANGVRLRVLGANVAGEERAAPEVVALARRLRVDVLAVAELTPEVADGYDAAGIAKLLPYRSLNPQPAFFGSGLYGRLPPREAPAPAGTRYGLSPAPASPRPAARAPGARGHALRALRRRGEPARRGALRGARHPCAGADLAARHRRLAARPAQAAEPRPRR